MRSPIALAFVVAGITVACSKKSPAPEPTAPTPAETKPAETKPAETKPAEANTEAKPAETKPAETKPAETKPAETAAPTAQEARAKRYLECWGFFNDKKYDDFKGCFAADFTDDTVDSGMPVTKGWDEFRATRLGTYDTAFPDFAGKAVLVVQTGNHTWGVHVFGGTHKGPLKTPMGDIPASGKRVGFMLLHHVEWQPDGSLVVHQDLTMDMATMLAQIGASQQPKRAVIEAPTAAPTIVYATGDAAEAAAAERYRKEAEALGKQDLAGALANLADDVRWVDWSMPADLQGKPAVVASMKAIASAFPDASMTPQTVVAAADYVVACNRFKGTNTGMLPGTQVSTGKPVDLGLCEIQRYADGKVVDNQVFLNELGMAAQLGLLGGGAPK